MSGVRSVTIARAATIVTSSMGSDIFFSLLVPLR